jgi:transposase
LQQPAESIPDVSGGRKNLAVIMDNHCVHKGRERDERLARWKNVSFHFTPTYASHANLAEVFFGKLSIQVLKAGNFKSVEDMCDVIDAFAEVHNNAGMP